MTKLKFKDGMEFDTSGKLRIEHRPDGFYVVGNGFLIPVKDQDEGQKLIKQLIGKE